MVKHNKLAKDLFSHKGSLAEWWYFDVYNNKGLVLILILYAKLGRLEPFSSLYITMPNSKHYKHHNLEKKLQIDQKRSIISLGNYKINFYGRGANINVSEHELSVNLTFTSVLKESNITFKRAGINWLIHSPRATVKGQIIYKNQIYSIKGEGYFDHNWFEKKYNIEKIDDKKQIQATLLGGWNFGRIASETNTIVYGVGKGESAAVHWNESNSPKIIKRLKLKGGNMGFTNRYQIPYPTNLRLIILDKTLGIKEIVVDQKRLIAETFLFQKGKKYGYLRFLIRGKIVSKSGKSSHGKGISESWPIYMT